MNTSPSKATQNIVKDLLDNNICKYCCLRYINEKNPDSYKNIEDTFNKLLKIDANEKELSPPSKQPKNNPCSACLGLLQLSDNPDFISKVADAIIEAGYDSDDVTFALSLPITFLLRNYSLWLFVTHKHEDFFADKEYADDLIQEFNVVSVKEAWKWLTAQKIAEKVNKSVNNGVNGNFHVNINIKYDKDENETSCLIEMFPCVFKNRSSQKRKFHGEILTRKSVESALNDVDYDLFKTHYPIPPDVPDCFVDCGGIECIQDSIYLAGRYNKLSRNLSQTPWMINGERKMETSVEEIISNPVSKIIKNNGIKFSSSGREDVDVRTLGNGRPFVLDVINPRRTKLDHDTIRTLENEINQQPDVFVRDLQLVKKEDLCHIKLGEQEKTKTYNSYCIIKLTPNEDINILKEKLNNLKDIKNLVIKQKTPIRVLHRRGLAVRPKTIHWVTGEFFKIENNQLFFKLRLKVEAGTYIKEFVHGDFGRTSPNLSEILEREVDILALDVEEVALDWPPSLKYNGAS